MSATMQTLPKKNWWEVGATDTLGGQSAQGPWSDNTPRQGGGASGLIPVPERPFVANQPSGGNAFGTTYADPGGGWNPWSLYDGRQGYDGTAADGHYNAAADTKKGWGPNGTPESDRDRVWRMTLADLGPNPGGQPPEKVKAAFLNNVARLKRDYIDTPGMGAQAWAGSAFSGYDRFAPGGGTGGNQGGQASTPAPVASSSSSAPGGQQGGTVTPNDPTNPYNNPTGATGGNPGGGAPLPTVPPTGGGGAAGNAIPAGAYYRTNPGVAVSQFLQQHNIGTGDHGPFADFLRKLATGIATPVMSVMPPGANGQSAGDQLNNLPSIINNLIYGNGGQVFGNLANFAGQAQGQFGPDKLKGMSFPDVQGLLSTINALKTMGQNPYMQSFNQQALADLFQKYQNTDFAGNQAGRGSTNPDWLTNPQNDPYALFR